MAVQYKVGDRVKWNSIYGETHGEVIELIEPNNSSGSQGDLRYKVKSAKTGKTAVHKGSALTKI